MSYHLADQKPIVYLFSPHTLQSGSTSAATPTMTPPASFPTVEYRIAFHVGLRRLSANLCECKLDGAIYHRGN